MVDNKVEFVVSMKDEATKTLSKVKGSLTSLPGLITAAFSVGAMKKFIDEANEAAKVHAQLQAVVKSTGGAAGLTANEIDKMAKELQKVTTFGDDAIKSAAAILLTFTKVKDDVFPQATEAILNMSAALGQDLKSSTIQVGKALQDPILGITALRRVGVQLSQTQEEQIRKFVEMGNVAGAQKVILGELETQFGGVARAIANTPAGKMEQLNNQLNDMYEILGTILMEVVTPLMPAFQFIVDMLSEAIPRVVAAIKTAFAGLYFAILEPFVLVEQGLNKLGISSSTFFQGLQNSASKIAVENAQIVVQGTQYAAEQTEQFHGKVFQSAVELTKKQKELYKKFAEDKADNDWKAFWGNEKRKLDIEKEILDIREEAAERAYQKEVERQEKIKSVVMDVAATMQQSFAYAFGGGEAAGKKFAVNILNMFINLAEGILATAAGAAVAKGVFTFGTTLAGDLALIAGAIASLEVARAAIGRFHNGGTVGDFSGQPASREFPIIVRGGETVRTEGQERDFQNSKGGSGMIVNVTFNSPVSDAQFVVNGIKKAMRETGLTIDKLAVNNRSKVVLA